MSRRSDDSEVVVHVKANPVAIVPLFDGGRVLLRNLGLAEGA
jgi:hypothetical protein